MKRTAFLLAVLFSSLLCSAKQRDLRLLTWDPPRYPFVAAAERIEGMVNLRLSLEQNGHVQAVEVISGHPQLRESAVEAAKKMIFACDQCQADGRIVRHISIKYQIKGKPSEERRERARKGGEGLIIVTINPLPIETQTAR